MADREQQDALLELLNSTPVINGVVHDELEDPEAARSWQRSHGGSGTAAERKQLMEVREALQQVVRGDRPATSLSPLLKGVTSHPRITAEGVSWEPNPPADRRMAVQAVLTWGALQQGMPGRLRPCANPECRLFLLDRSKTNKARWCSMALCGNRMKARRHYQRSRKGATD
ncbi:CGNR zinc finger domain-containing protein [Streptomyces sp. NPDC052023]|uniref:CGNR zinc finger domain-containing protein n=1 Tax=Streptomyces sp. NPDC052023 TaxID=3365681 RepID=UPI0037CE7D61